MRIDISHAPILIVDDQAANVQLLQQLLSDAGYTNLSATMNPLEVCALHKQHAYDLILLDIHMPRMDGFEVMNQLQATQTDSYLPVIVLTAQPLHKLRALQCGAKDFISKPFDLVEVKTRISNMLEVRLLHKKMEECNRLLEQTVLQRTHELRENEARFRRLTELASDWSWEQNAQGHFVNMPESLLHLLGIEATADPRAPDTLNGWNEPDRTAFCAALARRQSFIDLDFCRTDAAGITHYFCISGEPIWNDHGEFAGYIGLGTTLARAG